MFDIALAAHFKYGKTISGRGIFFKPNQGVDPETGASDPDSTEAHCTTVADVEVDTETGHVKVLKLTSAYEVGREINPKMVEGQIIGGAVMGTGVTLLESSFPNYPQYDPHPGSFNEYMMMGAADIPEMESGAGIWFGGWTIWRQRGRRNDRQFAAARDCECDL